MNYLRTLLRLAADTVIALLLLIGVAGTAYTVIAPDDGWLWRSVGHLRDNYPVYLIPALAIGAVGAIMLKSWLDGLNLKQRAGNVVMYLWAVLGLFFSVHWFATGSLA